MLLAIEWGSVGIKTLQFILSFSILITLHEMGHFFTAKWFKCRVEKFYLFFNPWFSLWKKKVGETEYGIGWVPFGGFVKISGMIDESMDKEQMKQPPQPYEFRSKPAWQRLIIMTGGVIVNVLLALVLFIMITYVWGEEYLPAKNVKYGIYADSLGQKIGLRDGDHVLAIDNKPLQNFTSLPAEIMLKDVKTLQVERDGQQVTVNIPDGFIKELNKNKMAGFADILVPFVVKELKAGAPAKQAGIQKGDRVIGIDSVATPYFQNFAKISKHFKNKAVHIRLIRNSDTLSIPLTVSPDGTIGAYAEGDLTKLGFEVETKKYSLAESVPVGIHKSVETLERYIAGFKQIFAGKVNASDSLGSVISIGNTFPGVWDWERFWTLTAIFSIILAFMNILPIPALDGGHALFTLVEMISGRKPSDKFMEYAQMAGMVLLLGLMAYALGLDFWRLFK